MIISVVFSKPIKNVCEILERNYKKIKIRAQNDADFGTVRYFCESFTEKQVFHTKMTEEELENFIKTHAGKTFKIALSLQNPKKGQF